MSSETLFLDSEGNNLVSEVNSIRCEICKATEFTKQCFAAECDKLRCATCVLNLCKKNKKSELKDDDGDLIYICTKVCSIFKVVLLNQKCKSHTFCIVFLLTIHRNAMKKSSHS